MISMDILYRRLIDVLPEECIFLNESMKKHTSFKIGGRADIMIMPTREKEISHALKLCKELDIPLFVMGNGSNLLVRDKGIRGMVIKIAKNFSNAKVEATSIKAQSGILLSILSKKAVENGLKGLEFACGIPGTLGGAVVMNAGAYGGEMKGVVKSVKTIDYDGNYHVFSQNEMNFAYRTSILQSNNHIVLEVLLELDYGDKLESSRLIGELNNRRKEKQPLSYPSAGSTFKRPVGYYAGKLIQDSGLKGLRIGDAQISDKHAGFIINLGNATAENVIDLISEVQEIILEKHGVEINPEVKIIGEE